ncbi:4Fe-4S double cluster binding domain-containing protein [Fusibacter sp. JL298sf-3]
MQVNLKEKKYYNRCIMCTRCIHNCPANAISYKNRYIQQYKVHYDIELTDEHLKVEQMQIVKTIPPIN